MNLLTPFSGWYKGKDVGRTFWQKEVTFAPLSNRTPVPPRHYTLVTSTPSGPYNFAGYIWTYDLCIRCRHCQFILSRDTNGTLRPISTVLPVFIPSFYCTSSQKFSYGFTFDSFLQEATLALSLYMSCKYKLP
jgi:hypothetical protein